MPAWQYVVAFGRVLFSLGLYGWVLFLGAASVGVGAWEEWGTVRKAINPHFKALVGVDMPPTLPWFFIGIAFLVIALFRLVHRAVMWEAVQPRLKFSSPKLAIGPIHMSDEYPDGTQVLVESRKISIIFVEVSNCPKARIGGKAAEQAWAKAVFENEVTHETKEVRYCRWEANRKPRQDTERTSRTPRYDQEWNTRTLPANGMPHRLDFGIFFEDDGSLFGFSAPAQEKYMWADPAHQLWQRVPIKTTIIIDAGNLAEPAQYTFRFNAGQRMEFL